jgi:two-component sensor histidine kinase
VLPRLRRNPLLAFPLAAAIFLIALATRFALDPYVSESLPFLTFFVPVLVATLVAGVAPGLLMVLLGSVAAWFLFLPPRYEIAVKAPAAASLAAFVAQALLLVFIGHVLNMLVERLSAERRRNEALLQTAAYSENRLVELNAELRHRLKNLFTIITSLLSQSSRYAPDTSALVHSVSGRLRAMGEAQDLLAANRFEGADLKSLCEKTLLPLAPPGRERLSASGPQTLLRPESVTSVALLFHELGTNAIKHGAWSVSGGSVHVTWRSGDGAQGVDIVWVEKDGPKVVAPTRRGFGSALLEKVIADAEIKLEFQSDGLRCSACLPVEATDAIGHGSDDQATSAP